ncbi:arsenosugar biosynthesis radical SAM (seleno)protein ArsS [Anaeroselena agilis]|uniref:Arsenosugar biosynthesis radical SAM protein ArsS n=1 Tax=Anaeroselena agilis TaxID=3063788 RepID=A0ABU3NUG3_9FIRM|nr:arsenosugar biosynthesis radical SAM protein ArsS [Selenomonadales bacterium 4137-cl]
MRSFQEFVDGAGQPLVRDGFNVFQVNMGYVCNLRCRHCHLEAGPDRREAMSREVVDDCLRFAAAAGTIDVDITGGAPEANENLTYFIGELRRLPNVKRIIVRSNLAILEEPGKTHLPEFFADHGVEIVSSMPCYLEDNVAAQRGEGIYGKNIGVLQRLNELGFGTGKLKLHLVYNPGGAYLPGPQAELEADYKKNLGDSFGIRFDSLFTIANMPIGRFRSDLEDQGQLAGYTDMLAESSNARNLAQVMCRSQISVDWQGRLFDCDFNQALGQPAVEGTIGNVTVKDLMGLPIRCGDHCFACTAGSGSSCQGSFDK